MSHQEIIWYAVIFCVIFTYGLLLRPRPSRYGSLREMGFPTHEELAEKGISGEDFFDRYISNSKLHPSTYPGVTARITLAQIEHERKTERPR